MTFPKPAIADLYSLLPAVISDLAVLALPMSRRDIADYLGLTLDTVFRALSQLHGQGVLGFLDQAQRPIVLLNRMRLAELDL